MAQMARIGPLLRCASLQCIVAASLQCFLAASLCKRLCSCRCKKCTSLSLSIYVPAFPTRTIIIMIKCGCVCVPLSVSRASLARQLATGALHAHTNTHTYTMAPSSRRLAPGAYLWRARQPPASQPASQPASVLDGRPQRRSSGQRALGHRCALTGPARGPQDAGFAARAGRPD